MKVEFVEIQIKTLTGENEMLKSRINQLSIELKNK